MHLKKVKGILSSSNGMNLYRGCTHGCIYCDSRSKCYHMEHAFEDVEVKENAIILLENTLKRKRLKCMLSTGSMTDPYIPLEDEFSSVRKALSLAYKYGFGFTLITKSNRVLKDLDLLKAINEKTKCVVQMTLTTYDEDLCKKIEPNVSTTKERVEALKKLHDAGIPTVVWLLMLSLAVMISLCHADMRLPGYLSWNVPFDGAAVRPITKGISSYIHALPAL